VNSFDPSSVRCFVTVFSPFVMGALMLMKIAIPLLLVAFALRAVEIVRRRGTAGASVRHLFYLIFIICDFMALVSCGFNFCGKMLKKMIKASIIYKNK